MTMDWDGPSGPLSGGGSPGSVKDRATHVATTVSAIHRRCRDVSAGGDKRAPSGLPTGSKEANEDSGNAWDVRKAIGTPH